MIRSAFQICSAYQRAGLALLVVCSFAVTECYGVTKEVTKTYPLKADGTFEII